MKSYFSLNHIKPIYLFIFFIALSTLRVNLLYAEYFSQELQIDSSTKTKDDSSVIPTNPFEIVEMIRRYNSLNDATNPSDAIDDALNSFYDSEEK